MSFFRHLKALMWKNTLLWKRRWISSLCEVLFPVFMVLMLVGIRQAVSNTDFSEGQRLKEGRGYGPISSISPTPSPFFADISSSFFEGDPSYDTFNPIAYGGYNYTIVGEDRTAVAEFQISLQPYLDLYKQIYKVDLKFTDDLKTEEELFEFVRANDYQRNSNREALLFSIGLPPKPEEDPYNYAIYMSANFPNHIPNTNFNEIFTRPLISEFESYTKNGFLTLQSIVANHIVKKELNGEAKIEVFMSMGSIKKFTRDEFMENIGPTLALFILLIFIAPQFRLVGFITQEKASKAREGMKIMGLNDSPYWISWFIYYFFVCLVISII